MKPVLILAVLLALAGCATAATDPAPPNGEFTATRFTFVTVDEADAICEARLRNGKRHWGCATYNHVTRACDVVVGDKARTEVIGKEVANCLRMAKGESS